MHDISLKMCFLQVYKIKLEIFQFFEQKLVQFFLKLCISKTVNL